MTSIFNHNSDKYTLLNAFYESSISQSFSWALSCLIHTILIKNIALRLTLQVKTLASHGKAKIPTWGLTPKFILLPETLQYTSDSMGLRYNQSGPSHN